MVFRHEGTRAGFSTCLSVDGSLFGFCYSDKSRFGCFRNVDAARFQSTSQRATKFSDDSAWMSPAAWPPAPIEARFSFSLAANVRADPDCNIVSPIVALPLLFRKPRRGERLLFFIASRSREASPGQINANQLSALFTGRSPRRHQLTGR